MLNNELNGFTVIPGFVDYYINKVGNVKYLKQKTQEILDVRIINKNNNPKSIYIFPRKEGEYKKQQIEVSIAFLLLITFVSSRKNSYQIPCFKDFNNLNLSLDNLYWATKKEYNDTAAKQKAINNLEWINPSLQILV